MNIPAPFRTCSSGPKSVLGRLTAAQPYLRQKSYYSSALTSVLCQKLYKTVDERRCVIGYTNQAQRASRSLGQRRERLQVQALAVPVFETAAAAVTTAATTALPEALKAIIFSPVGLAIVAFALGLLWLKRILDTPSRTYDPDAPNVGEEYDSWTQDGLVEYYWGEHIHLGYYTEEERAKGYKKKDFKKAKYDFVDEMLKFSGAKEPKRVLDVGCGVGGTSRMLAEKFPEAEVQAVTLSPEQVYRACWLAAEVERTNVFFRVMDALALEFADKTFDLVWACESGEHMPDKKKYVESMTRVLKPGGTLVLATWCQREETPENPFSEKDKAALQFLYDEWAHPYFVSIEEYGRLLEATGEYEVVEIADWTPQTLPTWRHSIWVGVWDPWIVIRKGPAVWYKVIREIVTIERMHRAFNRGLMVYGMARAVRKKAPPAPVVEEALPVAVPVSA